MIKQLVFRILAVVVLGLMAVGPVRAAETLTLAAGEQAIAAGQYDQARAMALGALAQDEQNYDALMVLTAAEIGLGNWDRAKDAARQAFDLAANDAQRAGAARLLASAYFRAGQYSRAEWWLRRALHNAPDTGMQQALRQDYRIVRQKNPLTARLSFSLAPNNNVNNGSTTETVTIWNLPFVLSADARALAGTELAAGIDLQYRISESKDHATYLGLLLFGRTYELSRAAKAAAPDVSGSDYSFAATEISLTHNQRFKGSPGPTSFGLNIGKNWYGTDPYTRYERATVSQEFRLDDNSALSGFGAFEHQVSIRDGGTPSKIYSLGGSVVRRLGNGDGLNVSLQTQKTTSSDPGNENRAYRARLNYSLGRVILGTNLSLSASLEKRDYDFSIYDPSGRRDLTASAGATVVFSNASYFGFSPLMSLEATETKSNVDLYDRRSVAIRFGIQSNF